jgi:hypothetical protein
MPWFDPLSSLGVGLRVSRTMMRYFGGNVELLHRPASKDLDVGCTVRVWLNTNTDVPEQQLLYEKDDKEEEEKEAEEKEGDDEETTSTGIPYRHNYTTSPSDAIRAKSSFVSTISSMTMSICTRNMWQCSAMSSVTCNLTKGESHT